MLSGSVEIRRQRTHGCLRRLRLRVDEPRGNMERKRIYRARLRRFVRLPRRRFLFGILRHDGHAAHERVRHHARTIGACEREEPHERVLQPLRAKTPQTLHSGCTKRADGRMAPHPPRHLRDVRRRGGDHSRLGRRAEETGRRGSEDSTSARQNHRNRTRHGRHANG